MRVERPREAKRSQIVEAGSLWILKFGLTDNFGNGAGWARVAGG